MNDNTMQEFKPLFKIPNYLINEFGDAGLVQSVVIENDSQTIVEQEELVLTVELAGGITLLIDNRIGNCLRLVATSSELIIEGLQEV